MNADVLIVPDHSDLNVYRTASKDSNAEVGCCGPAGKAKSSGCGTKDVVEDAQLADVDLNEWAGMWFLFLGFVVHVELIFSRLV